MNSINDPDKALARRRRRERFLVVLGFTLIIVFGFIEGWFIQLQADLPLSSNIFLYAFVNLNVLLLLLLIYLVLRNIVKLVFERKKNIMGHRLRTRLVIASVGLTLIPTIPLFWFATQLIFSSLDHWISSKVEQSLEQSVKFAKEYLDREGKDLARNCEALRAELLKSADIGCPEVGRSDEELGALLGRLGLDDAFIIDVQGTRTRIRRIAGPSSGSAGFRIDAPSLLQSLMKEPEGLARIVNVSQERKQALSQGREGVAKSVGVSPEKKREAVAVRLGLPSSSGSSEAGGQLVAVRFISPYVGAELEAITTGYEDYLQLKLLHVPLKRSHFIIFSIITLLAIFAAVWFAFFIARSLTVPIQSLVTATRRVAEGDLDVRLERDRTDEIGMLMVSFNQMVQDLRESREKLANAYGALQRSHVELEERRRYMEIVLKNVAAAVVSVDASGNIVTMNKSAEAIFGLQADEVRGRPYSTFLQPAQAEIVTAFMESYRENRQPHLERRIQIMMGKRPTTLLVKASVLRDERGERMGVVAVIDDLTDLERAQRMAAWREVARRIAHEIKNPLTPIQLSAQRLRRKHPELINEEGSVFDECTRMIVQQVEHMMRLVNEFSKFARLPGARPVPSDLTSIVEEILALYRHNYPNIAFSLEKEGEIPLLKLDRDQFHQVMINLLDNAVHAMGGKTGAVSNRLSYDPTLKIAKLECADTGHGLSAEDKLRMFEPYYSRKKKGTGLGLAIVASIIADHNGFVRVRDNEPHGTVIVIELPG